jgi:CRISPR/Cas system-associated protein Cas10 (large subunit of type III CRISPR-Cas system)
MGGKEGGFKFCGTVLFIYTRWKEIVHEYSILGSNHEVKGSEMELLNWFSQIIYYNIRRKEVYLCWWCTTTIICSIEVCESYDDIVFDKHSKIINGQSWHFSITTFFKGSINPLYADDALEVLNMHTCRCQFHSMTPTASLWIASPWVDAWILLQ